jgi:hypothetical protein
MPPQSRSRDGRLKTPQSLSRDGRLKTPIVVKRHLIEYKPRSVFKAFHARVQRFACIVAHRRAGKTVASLNDMVRRAVDPRAYKPTGGGLGDPGGRDGRYAFVAPFLGQAKEAAWEYLKRYARPLFGTVAPNESELWVELVNGARIRIHGADNPDRLRGAYLDGVVMDEFADMRPAVWGEIIRPMLADRQGWATFIGTPKGRNEFHKLYQEAQTDPNWFSALMRASDTRVLPQEELDALRADMTAEQYSQELECSFEAAILGAYYGAEMAEAEAKGRIRDLPIEPGFPVHTSWDLGKGQNMPVWCFQVIAGEVRFVDYIEDYNATLERLAETLNERGYNGVDFVPQDAKVASLETGRTRIETLWKLKRKPALVTRHNVIDGINAARLMFKVCAFDRVKCAAGLEALRQYRAEYDEKRKCFLDVPRHDWCMVGETKILTRYGTHRINDLPESGEVLTSCGWKQYRRPRITRRNAPLVAVTFVDGLTVRCTPDHLFKTASGWRSAASLTRDSAILCGSTPSRHILTAVFIGFGRPSAIFRGAAKNFIKRFGKPRSAQFPKAVTSITAITMSPMRDWSIWSALRKESISSGEGKIRFQAAPGRRPPNGIALRLADCGTAARLSAPEAGPNGSALLRIVRNAARYLTLWRESPGTPRSTAQTHARLVLIESVSKLSETADVWCLEVPGVEEFALANGALAHNCSHGSDAFRYAAMAWRTPQKPKDEANKPPDLRPLARIEYDEYEEFGINEKRMERV